MRSTRSFFLNKNNNFKLIGKKWKSRVSWFLFLKNCCNLNHLECKLAFVCPVITFLYFQITCLNKWFNIELSLELTSYWHKTYDSDFIQSNVNMPEHNSTIQKLLNNNELKSEISCTQRDRERGDGKHTFSLSFSYGSSISSK